ncbi:MAG: IS110 family transposase [Rectinema subterraneum]|uniref:IS110 family transposase n=1 Tax=Rectinema subterraneum TaxID=2653714 RepID=UPI003C7B4E57
MQYIAFDSHKRYTYAVVEDPGGNRIMEQRIEHRKGELAAFLTHCEPHSPVALETIGSWYWIVDEIEAADMEPKLVNARRAKMMLCSSKKTDRLDARGMNTLQRAGTLPTVWIPPGKLRDIRELFRTRMVFKQQVTRLKNRILSCFSKYGISFDETTSDAFNVKGRTALQSACSLLPVHTRESVTQLLAQLDGTNRAIAELEARMREVSSQTPDVQLLLTIPGIGPILSHVIAYEIGDIRRFASASHLASYAGTTPSVHASGGKVRYGHAPADVNHYLQWAFVEAANCIALRHTFLKARHVAQLYARLRATKGHGVAVGAVARHLAEAAYWVLTTKSPYKEPQHARVNTVVSSKKG